MYFYAYFITLQRSQRVIKILWKSFAWREMLTLNATFFFIKRYRLLLPVINIVVFMQAPVCIAKVKNVILQIVKHRYRSDRCEIYCDPEICKAAQSTRCHVAINTRHLREKRIRNVFAVLCYELCCA